MLSYARLKSGKYYSILFLLSCTISTSNLEIINFFQIINFSTFPNVIESMLEYHLGSYLRKNVGEVWLNTPSTIGPVIREGDGGQFKVWPYKPIDQIVGNP